MGVPECAHRPNSNWLNAVLVELQATLGVNFDPVTAWLGRQDLITGAHADHLQQKWWSEALGRKAMQTLLDHAPPRDQARLLEQANSIGSSFMSVPPSTNLQTILKPDVYRLALKWWIGTALLESGEGLTCSGCQRQADVFGDHLLCCPRNNYTRRHAAVQDALHLLLTSAGQGVDKEVPIRNCPDQRLRPADLLLRHWDGGQHLAVDLTIAHGWQVSEQQPPNAISRERWRRFLCLKETEKHTRYDAVCAGASWSFRPWRLGRGEGWGPNAPNCYTAL